VPDAFVPPFAGWETFYVMVGSSGGALTGLQFVVVTLMPESRVAKGQSSQSRQEGIKAYGTPTVVHFCMALLVAAVMTAPWHEVLWADLLVGICGGGGIVYLAISALRVKRLTEYQPVFEDWLSHTALPFIAYAILLVSAFTLGHHLAETLFAIAAAALFLLFIGIHNAWDTVTFIALERLKRGDEEE